MTTINWYEFDENKKSDLASLNFISNIDDFKKSHSIESNL